MARSTKITSTRSRSNRAARGTVTVIDHPVIQHKLTLIREASTTTIQFRQLMREVAPILLYEATRDLPLTQRRIRTPVATVQAPVLAGKKLCLVPVLRAGLGLVEAMLGFLPNARVGHIGLYRDPETLEAIEYYFKMPTALDKRLVVVVDPMLATGHSAVAALTRVKQAGARNVKLICLLAAPEGVAAVQEAHRDVDIYLASIDEKLNSHAYIVPGLGDAGDRFFGTKGVGERSGKRRKGKAARSKPVR
jgi:uracil phosphoribosyltransferase